MCHTGIIRAGCLMLPGAARVHAGVWVMLLLLACVAGCTGARAPRSVVSQAHGVVLAWRAADCFAADTDRDRDALHDACELALATAFAPVLVVVPRGCNWDAAATPKRLGGGYLFAAQRTDTGVRIAYLPAYFRDCGWQGAKCVLPGVDCAPHAGDSEVIIVDVEPSAQSWRTVAVFLSAHCFGRSGGDCRWYAGDELDRFAWHEQRPRGAPIVWVSEGRQANYPSWSACDRGHHRIDSCDRNTYAYRFPIVTASQNVGSAAYPAQAEGCIAADELPLPSRLVAANAVECFWSSRTFGGWQATKEGSTPYALYLRDVARFSTVGR